MVSSIGTRKRSSLKSPTSAKVRARASRSSSAPGAKRSVVIASPGGGTSRSGNSITARRYSRILRSAGYRVRIAPSSGPVPDAGMLIALHATKSAALVAAFRKTFPRRPVVVVLTGTDVYGSLARSRAGMRAVASADAIVTLQPLAIARLPAALRKKAVAVVQSAQRVKAKRAKRSGTALRLCVVGHVRREKDPLRAAYALRHLKDRNVEVVQAGGVLDQRYAATMARLQRRDSRYRYLGELPRAAALRLLAGCDALVLSSRSEGGANVASEAIANGVAVLASRIDGNVGVLGKDYAGYYPVGSSKALAKLIERFAGDPAFARTLRRQIRALRPTVAPQRERDGLLHAIALARANAARGCNS